MENKSKIKIGDILLVVRIPKGEESSGYIGNSGWTLGETYKVTDIRIEHFYIHKNATSWDCLLRRLNPNDSLFTFILNTPAAKILFS